MSGKKQVAEVMREVAEAIETGNFQKPVKVALTTPGSEHGEQELCRAAEIIEQKRDDIKPVLIGTQTIENAEHHSCETLNSAHEIMKELFSENKIDCAVTLHYNFPLGVATVGRVLAPCSGEEMLIATTTGTSAAGRVKAMVKNAIAGQVAARAINIKEPELGILNIEGARKVEQVLSQLQKNGADLKFADSVRGEGGSIMRGNDLLIGSCDVMVCDSLTGNLLMKLFSARDGGGKYEVSGYGYGPALGEDQENLIGIVSRASGAPVIAGAMEYMADSVQGNLRDKYRQEMAEAREAGLYEIVASLEDKTAGKNDRAQEISVPPEKKTEVEISGVDVLEIESARESLWKEGIYAETGMGCSGPVVMVADEDEGMARELLQNEGYL